MPYQLSGCGLGDVVYDGMFTDGRTSFDLKNFSVSRQGTPVVSATGSYGGSTSRSGLSRGVFWNFAHFESETTGLRLVDSRVNEELVATECAIGNPGCAYAKTLDVQLDITAPWTGGRVLSGGGTLQGDGEANYSTGTLTLQSDDASVSVALDTDGGDPETFVWTRTADGSTVSDPLPVDRDKRRVPGRIPGGELELLPVVDGGGPTRSRPVLHPSFIGTVQVSENSRTFVTRPEPAPGAT